MTQSKAQHELTEEVRKLMRSASDCFPHNELSPGTASEYMSIWIALAEGYGIAHLKAAVNRLKFNLDFFPKPAEIKREIAVLILEEKKASSANSIKFVSCGACNADGYVCVNSKGERWTGNKNEDRLMRECQCKTEWKAKRQSKG